MPYADVGYVVHGTTVATNAIIEGKLAPTGFVADPCDRAGDAFFACVRVRLLKAKFLA